LGGTDTAGRIKAVLDARRTIEPQVEHEVAYWEKVQTLLGQLDRAVRSLRDDESGTLPAAVAQVADLDVPELRKVVTATLAELADVRARISRKTINIGVSGRRSLGLRRNAWPMTPPRVRPNRCWRKLNHQRCKQLQRWSR
jgi:hypothetical protein